MASVAECYGFVLKVLFNIFETALVFLFRRKGKLKEKETYFAKDLYIHIFAFGVYNYKRHSTLPCANVGLGIAHGKFECR